MYTFSDEIKNNIDIYHVFSCALVFRLAKERQRRLHVRGVLGPRQGHVERRAENGIAEEPQRRVFQIARPVDVPGGAQHAGRRQSHGHRGHAGVGPQRQGRIVSVTRLPGIRAMTIRARPACTNKKAEK